jgi:hypothetical protein
MYGYHHNFGITRKGISRVLKNDIFNFKIEMHVWFKGVYSIIILFMYFYNGASLICRFANQEIFCCAYFACNSIEKFPDVQANDFFVCFIENHVMHVFTQIHVFFLWYNKTSPFDNSYIFLVFFDTFSREMLPTVSFSFIYKR